MKRNRIIVCIVLLIFVILFIGVKFIHRNDNKELSSYEKQMKINEFVEKEKGTEPTEEPEPEGATDGEVNTSISIINKAELLKVYNTDEMLSISDSVNISLEDISELNIEDINRVEIKPDSVVTGDNGISKFEILIKGADKEEIHTIFVTEISEKSVTITWE